MTMEERKRHKNQLQVLFFIAIIILFQSCSKKGCTDPTADNYDASATESNDNCIAARDKFIGNYSVQAQCSDSSYTYDISISAAQNGIAKVTIQNFGDMSTPVNATISGKIIELTESIYNNKTISGSGELSGYTLVIHYLSIDVSTNDSVSCSLTAIKQ